MTLKPFLSKTARESLAHKGYVAEQVRRHEPGAAKKSGCTLYDLMERAGQGLFRQIEAFWPGAASISIVVGTGNNGGDGYVLARLAHDAGRKVSLYSLNPGKPLPADAARARQAWLDAGGEIKILDTDSDIAADLIVDGLLGTGLKGQVREEYQRAIAAINRVASPVLSIDVPSGLEADTGEMLADEVVQADVTLTFVAFKTGMLTGRGKGRAGRLILDELGVAPAFKRLADASITLVKYRELVPIPDRFIDAHKGQFGRLLCIGGNRGMAGAIRMSAEAALRSGTGLVKIYCHPDSCLPAGQGRPEIMLASDNLTQHLDWADCIVIGPGLGTDKWARNQFSSLLGYLQSNDKPLIVDADGLNLLAELHAAKGSGKGETKTPLASQCVITPHPAEAARLLESNTTNIESDRYKAARDLAKQYDAACILKGAGSLIQSNDECYVCSEGNPGMATAGMGDILSGVVGAMLAQDMSRGQAALYACCLHALAGDLAAEKGGQRGMLASDLFPCLRLLVNY